MDQLSICFLGTGKINRRHVRIVRRLRPHAALAVASRDAARAAAFRDQLGLRNAFGSYEEAIASSYGTIVVGVPPRTHLALLRAVLGARKHALVEKPILSSHAELQELWPELERHRQAGGVMMVAENLHYAPFHRRLKRILEREDLGLPLFLELNRPGRSNPTGWRADPDEMPLGALHEGGVHWIRRLLDLAAVFEADDPYGGGNVIGVRAYGPAAPITSTPGEDTMLVLARHRSGLVSRLFHSWGVPWRFPPFDVSKAILSAGALYFDGRGIFGRLYGRRRRRLLWPNIRDAAGYVAMWRDFLRAVEAGGAPELALETTYHDFAYMDAAYRSLATGAEERPAPLPGSQTPAAPDPRRQ